MRLCLVEDLAVANLEPLTLTRPAYQLLLGTSALEHKLERAFGADPGSLERAAVIRPYLAALQQKRAPRTAVNDRQWLARGPVVVANGRWVPPVDFVPPTATPPWLGHCKGRPACAWVDPERAVALEPNAVDDWFDDLASKIVGVEVGGDWIEYPWDLVLKNPDQVVRDFEAMDRSRVGTGKRNDICLVGPSKHLIVHETARIDPYTVFDTTNGPIIVGPNVWVQPFTRIEGPSYIGAGTHLFRANLRGGVTIGPTCRIGGEVETSIIQGFSNKYHEGFLGHAYAGEWINLGAITSNSDLRNDYGEVQVPLHGDPIPTGTAKVGCFIGDHTRTGLGSMLNTGTSIGVMCNVLPAGPLLPKHIPSFTAIHFGRVASGFALEQMFATARTVKGRRGLVFDAVEEQLYLDLFEQTRLERERAFQKTRERRRHELWPTTTMVQ